MTSPPATARTRTGETAARHPGARVGFCLVGGLGWPEWPKTVERLDGELMAEIEPEANWPTDLFFTPTGGFTERGSLDCSPVVGMNGGEG